MTSHPDTPHPDTQAGFTLIEVTVVLLVLSLCLGIFVAAGPARSPRLQLDAATASTVQSLRAARVAAIAANRPVRVVFSTGKRSIATEAGPGDVLPARLSMTLPDGPLLAIAFASDGSSSGGEVEFASGALSRRIRVNPLTGRVSVAAAP